MVRSHFRYNKSEWSVFFKWTDQQSLHAWNTSHWYIFKHLLTKKETANMGQQESPPAWTQEAYRPPRSKYTPCCFSWGYPPTSWPGTCIWGVPPILLTGDGVPPPSWPGKGYPLFWPGMGVSPILTCKGDTPCRCGRTDACENITFPIPSECVR